MILINTTKNQITFNSVNTGIVTLSPKVESLLPDLSYEFLKEDIKPFIDNGNILIKENIITPKKAEVVVIPIPDKIESGVVEKPEIEKSDDKEKEVEVVKPKKSIVQKKTRKKRTKKVA